LSTAQPVFKKNPVHLHQFPACHIFAALPFKFY